MSRSSIPNTMFSAASPGLGKFAATIAGSKRAGQDAYDQELMAQSKMGLMLAQMKAAQAKADESQHALDMQSAPAVRNRAMLEAGIPLDAGPQVDDYLNTGKVGLWKPGSDAGLKGAPSAPSWWDASKMGPLASRIAAAQSVQAGEAKGAEDYYKGQNQLYETDLNRRIVNGVMPADQMARGMALQKATPLYKIPEGYTGNQFTGDIDVTAPVNSAHQGYVGAQTRAQNANAVQSYASAGEHAAGAREKDARTAQVRQEIAQGSKGHYDPSSGMIIDERTGQARPVMGLDGQPVGPKLKDIPPAQNTSIIENNKALANIDAAIAAVTQSTGLGLDDTGNPVRIKTVTPSSPDALGNWNYIPEALRQRSDPKGVTVRARVAQIAGQRFHDLSGAAVSVGEAARLKPFIPDSRDDAPTVLRKLANLKREYQFVNNQLGDFYSKGNGYKPAPVTTAPETRPPLAAFGSQAARPSLDSFNR